MDTLESHENPTVWCRGIIVETPSTSYESTMRAPRESHGSAKSYANAMRGFMDVRLSYMEVLRMSHVGVPPKHCRDSIEIPGMSHEVGIYGSPLEVPWESHASPMGSPWKSHGGSTEALWESHGSPWRYYNPIEVSGESHGNTMDIPRKSHVRAVYLMQVSWKPQGYSASQESDKLSWNFHGASIGLPRASMELR